MPYYKKEYMIGGADIFLDWLNRQAKALPVLQRAHVSKGYLYLLFVIPYQIFIQYVNEFLDAYHGKRRFYKPFYKFGDISFHD